MSDSIRREDVVLKVGIMCESSGVMRDAFTERGHDAISCDLLPTESPGPHHQGDAVAYLESLPDGYFDLIICHPECTKLCVSGNRHYGKGKPRHHERLAAAAWTERFWNLCKRKAKSVALENPVGVLSSLTSIPPANYVQPYQFGHPEQKNTGFHLHNLPPLATTDCVYDEMMKLPRNQRERTHFMSPGTDRWKKRSKTFTGIAKACAAQWTQSQTAKE